MSDVNVFLNGTTIGTYTDIDGNYKLESIPAGNYDLVFSHIGYRNETYQISEFNGGKRIQLHQMEVDLDQLEEVEVISNRVNPNQSEWQIFYQTFRKELLGTSSNARNCIIENPEAINFSFLESSEQLRSFTSAPLAIRNDALGYRISYFLESFSKSKNGLRYRGKMQFRTIEPISKTEKRSWKSNRKKSFKGSLNHFKRALISNNLKKEGFRIYSVKNLNEVKTEKKNELKESDIITFKGDHYLISFNNYLLIEFVKEKESVDYLTKSKDIGLFYSDYLSSDSVLVKEPGHQLSMLKLLKSQVRMDLSGQIVNKFALTTYGYWAWERLADLVPVNYDFKKDNL